MLFIGTFFICLFIFMMQFLWRYVDELVGKGLEMSVLAQFFFYSASTLVPVSLPLAVLLASLITFGNFGERYELLAMKAAGISLLKIMRPLIVFVCGVVGVSFLFPKCGGTDCNCQVRYAGSFHEAEISGAGYSGRGVLFRNSGLQSEGGEERPEDGYALRCADL